MFRAVLFLATASLMAAVPDRQFQTWKLQGGRIESSPGATDAPMAVGSLQKPFVAKAWAAGHPGQAPPRIHCPPGPGCWNRRGHGELGLVQALALSCNTYFRTLATAIPGELLRSTFAEAGFIGSPQSPEAAVGLFDGGSPPVIRPSVLLGAYLALVNRPWSLGEEARLLVLAGLKEAAHSGTAGGQRNGWAKTGTLPLDPIRTCGVALVVDESGWALLGRLEPGTGREAAMKLAASTPGATDRNLQGTQEGMDSVTVRVFELLRGRRVFVRNPGTSTLLAAGGFLGPGGKVELTPGRWVGPGLLELQEPKSGLTRRLRGRVECRSNPSGGKSLALTSSSRDYVSGVIAAELSSPADPLRKELGAAVLRFLAQGPRHPDADVCDSTHCAWFVGLGSTPSTQESTGIDDRDWDEMRAKARVKGPSQWSSHCGGHPLSPHRLWGQGDREAPPCLRHLGDQRPWRRTWSREAAESAFGAPIVRLETAEEDGKWVLRITGPGGTRTLDYDEAHRRIARILGWGALPSPADEIVSGAGGFLLKGVGLGHRVGLCLGE